MKFLDKNQIAAGFVPLDLQTQRDGDYFKAGDYRATLVKLVKGTGTDGDDPIITLQQAQDNAGTGVKALNFTEIQRKQATDILTVGQFTKIVQAAANTYTNTDGHQQAIWVIEIDRTQLDLANGFNFIRATLNDTGTNPQLGYIEYIGLDFIGTPPSAL